ncbi:unnamed protein product, partial [Ascophyllum nodosum]
GNFKIPEVLQVILVGVVLGWMTGLNNFSEVGDARDLVKWYGPTWAGKDIVEKLYDAKDYLGII